MVWTGNTASYGFVEDNGTVRTQVSIPDPAHFGPRAVLSPDSRTLAIASVDIPGADPMADAVLMLHDLRSGTTQTHTRGVDSRALPVWNAAGDALAFRRYATGVDGIRRDSIWTVGLHEGEPTLVLEAHPSESLFLVDWTEVGLRALRVTKAGTSLVQPGQPDRFLTADPVYEMKAGPEGTLAFAVGGDRPRLGLIGDEVRYVPVPGPFAVPAWKHDGTITIAGEPAKAAVNVEPGIYTADSRAGAARSFDLPVAWSPDDRALAARTVWFADDGRPTTESIVILSNDGQRSAVRANGYVEIVGWVTP